MYKYRDKNSNNINRCAVNLHVMERRSVQYMAPLKESNQDLIKLHELILIDVLTNWSQNLTEIESTQQLARCANILDSHRTVLKLHI